MRDTINRRILIIDDNRAIHEDFRKILSSEEDESGYGERRADYFGDSPEKCRFFGFDLDSAFQGREGLEMVAQAQADGRPYGVAFIDVRMPPGWDGIETTAKIWEVCPELQVVICTAYSDYDRHDLADKLGQTDRLLILKKPFDNVEALQMAETLAQKWTLARQARLRLVDLDAMVNQRTQELLASNERLTREIAERSRTQVLLSAFSTLASLLSKARMIPEAGQIVVDTADRLLGWDACLLELYSRDTGMLKHVLTVDVMDGQRKKVIPKAPQRPLSPMARKVLQEGGQLQLKSNPNEMQPGGLPFGDTARPSASLMCVPIRNGKDAIGLVSLQSYTPNAYDPQSLETLQALADHCGGALDRIQIEEALKSAQEQLRQSQKLDAIGHLSGGIAHDFNNLLSVISGNAELARRQAQGLPSDSTEFLDQILAATSRAANLTRQLLAFSRKQIMQSQPIDLDGVIMNLSKMLKRIIGEDIDLLCQYGPALPPVQADIGMLEQVLVNLVVNARDAMPDGGQLFIMTKQATFQEGLYPSHPEARPGDFVCMAVKDTGTGIAPENLALIFEPFFTTKDVGKGTGLGLATVYGIVKQHQGWIEVASEAGAGASFTIYLPALEAGRQVSKERTSESIEPPGGTETILLVEDEESVRSITGIILERAGYHVLAARSGPEALKIWESASSEIDLLLTDVIMPEGVTGRKLAEDLRLKKASLKVIFQSGYSGEVLRDSSEFLRLIDGYFLQKPCFRRDLLWAVRHCLDGLPPPARTASFGGLNLHPLLFPPRAHLIFCAAWISPSPPQTCGGEGRGEEAQSEFPLSLSLSPLGRGEGMPNCVLGKTLPKSEMRPSSTRSLKED